MASVTDILRQYAFGTPTAQAPQAPTLPVRAPAISDDIAYRVAAARNNRSGTSITNPIERDLIDLTTGELIAKYGLDAMGMIAARAQGQARYRNDRYDPTGNTLGDTASGLALGAATTLGGLGALGLGSINDDLGAWASRKVDQGAEWVRSRQSDGLNVHRRANRVINELDTNDNQARFEQDRKTDGDFVTSLKKIGRNAVSSVGNALEDNTILTDGLAEGAGSLLAIPAIGKAASIAGRATLRGGLESGVISRSAARTALRTGAKYQIPATIGATEAGGAYQQTVNQVLGMKHDQLMQASPEYAALIEQGWDPEDAQIEIATSAGLTAAGITAPVAVAAGKLVAPFEKNPFKFGPLGSSLGNIAKEGVEETVQSGSGQFAQNLGIKAFANQNQDLSEGVGEAAGLGGLYGMGSAGLVQAPSIASRAAVVTGKAVGTAAVAGAKAVAGPIIDAAGKRLDQFQAERAANSPVSAENLTQANEQAVAAMPEVRDQVEQVIAENKVPEEQAQQIRTRLDQLDANLKFDPTELDQHDLDPEVKDFIAPATNRFDALHRAAKIAGNTKVDPNQRVNAALFINEQLDKTKIDADLVNAIEAVPDEHPALAQLRQHEDVLVALQQNPEIVQARKVAQQYVANLKPSDVSETKIDTPSGQTAVKAVASVAQTDPANINPDIADLVLEHARSKGTLTPEQQRYVSNAAAIARMHKSYLSKLDKLGRDKQDIVSDEVLRNQDDGTPYRSASAHLKGVTAAMRSGDMKLASERLKDMMLFAQHMQNKVQANNQSFVSGTGSKDQVTSYQALTGNRKWVKSPTGTWVQADHTGSIGNAQQVALDAEAMGQIANHMATTFPELGVQPITLAQADPGYMAGDAKTVSLKFKREKRRAQKQGAQTKTTPTTTNQEAETAPAPEPVAEPAAEPVTKVDPEPAPAPSPEPKKSAEVQPAQAEPSKAETSKVVEPATEPDQKENTPAEPQKTAEQVEAPVAETGAESNTDQEVLADPAEAKTIAEAFPHLVQSEHVENWLVKAFKLPGELRSRLLGLERPVKAVRDALMSSAAMQALIGAKPAREVSTEVSEAYAQYLKNAVSIHDAMAKNLTQFLKTEIYGQPVAELLKNGAGDRTPVNALPRGKALNIVENQDGQFAYNEQLLQGSILAGLQWLVGAVARGRNYDDERIARALGIEEHQVTPGQREWFNNALPLIDAKQSIADTIKRFWGLSAERTAPEGYVQGISEALAAEVIRAMVDTKLLTANDLKVGVKSYLGFTPTDVVLNEKTGRTLLETLQRFPDAIERSLVVEPTVINHIGAPPKNVATHQLHGSPVPLQKQQREAIERAQNIVHRPNRAMFQFYAGLGDQLVNLFGKGNPTGKGINVNHAKAIEGYNRTLTSAFTALDALMAELEAAGSGEVYYEYGITSVGRMQMLGAHNPQASKLVREVMLPTWSTLDLTDTSGPHYQAFMLAMAQHLGIKVHKLPLIKAVEQVENLLANDFTGSLEMLDQWLSHKDDAQPLDLEQDDIDLLKRELGKELSPAAVHALIEYARFQQAKATGDHGKFETGLYLEADGVTDGPINALMNLSSGRFTSQWLDRMNRGGLFLTSTKTSMGDYAAKDAVDLYELTTQALAGKLDELWGGLSGDLAEMNQALGTVMLELLDDLQLDGDELKIGRGIAKNPLTVTVYGSGTAGIANKITSALLDKLYERLSEPGQQTSEAFQQALTLLTTHQVERGDFGRLSVKPRTNIDLDTKSGTAFTLTPEMTRNLQTSVLHLFASPLRKAINDQMGDAIETANLIRKATQVQAIHFKYAFKQAVADELANREKSTDPYVQHNFLSKAELQQILDRLLKTYPMIDTGTQLIWVGGSEKADIEGNPFGAAFDESYRTDPYIQGPSNPGVSGIPFVVIATGDGQMVLNALTGEQALDGVLPVFDGINMPLDKVFDQSTRINQAVYDGWQGNPVQAVADSFTRFVEAIKVNTEASEWMSDEMALEVHEALFGRFREKGKELAAAQAKALAARGNLNVHTSLVQEALKTAAKGVAARKAVLAQVNMTVDHMAAASSPYVVSDQTELPTDLNEAAKVLEQLRQDELAKEPVTKQAPVKEDTSFAGTLARIGTVLASGTRLITREDLRNVADRLSIPLPQRSLVREAVASLSTKGWIVLHGTPEQLQAHARENNLTLPDLDANHGVAMVGDKTVYLVSPSSETLAHELVHAATIERVYTTLANPKDSTPQIRDAVARIQGLMTEFLAFDESQIKDRDTLVQYAKAVEQIEWALENNPGVLGQAAALNEFMAWTLANPELAQLSRNTKVQNKLLLIAQKVLAELKKLWRKGLAPSVGEDLYSNLRFNTLVIMQAKPARLGNAEDLARLAQFHAKGYGESDRLSQLEEQLLGRARAVLAKAGPLQQEQAKDLFASTNVMAQRMTQRFRNAGWSMTQQQASLFTTLVTVFAIDDKLDGNAQSQVHKLYDHVLDKLTVEHLMDDPESLEEADRYLAQSQYEAIVGSIKLGKDKEGRTALVPSFLALANIHDGFRKVLDDIGLPETGFTGEKTVDGVLSDLGTKGMDWLAKTTSGQGKSDTLSGALSALTRRLAESQEEREAFVDKFVTPTGSRIDKINDYVSDKADVWSTKAADKIDSLVEKTQSNPLKILGRVTSSLVSIVNQERSGQEAEGLMSLMNRAKLPQALHDLANEIVGRTKSNAPVYDLIKLARSTVSQLRQRFREDLPQIVRDKFARKLMGEEWTTLYRGLARTDLTALHSTGSKRILNLLRDASKVKTEIARLENQVSQLDPAYAALLKSKAQELATHMNTGKVSSNLLRNADAIAHLLGELSKADRRRRGEPDKRLIKAIDELTSLYALEGLSTEQRTSMAKLAAEQAEGMGFVLDYLAEQRKDETAKQATERAYLNRYKGHVPTETTSGASLIVAENGKSAELERLGYSRVGDYAGSASEHAIGHSGMSYFFAPLSAKSPFNQGIAQTVRSTYHGVDPVTGFSFGLHGAGRITDPAEVRAISQKLHRNGLLKEPLMPVYDAEGDIVAYERSIDPNQKARLEEETDLSKVLGIWRGRQAEEANASAINQALVERLHDIWDQRPAGSEEEFVDLFADKKHKDPIIKDAMELLTPELRRLIKNNFGGDGFMVRRDMINDAIGYRSASLGDNWTGTTRLNPKVAETAAKVAELVMGKNAYVKVVNAERLWQNFVSDARSTIVVKSVVVPVSNIVSNIYQLAANGVPLHRILRDMPKKAAEIHQYRKNRQQEIQIEAEMRAAGNDIIKLRPLRAKLRAIQDGYRRLSIWPLIQAGEFSAVSEATVLHHDQTLFEGKLSNYVESLVDKLPDSVRTAGKYAIISRDTALYKGLQLAVEYGDFLAKAVLYDDLTERKQLNQEQAIARVTEEFINYDRLPGRFRGSLESMGILWFYHFKLRSLKVALASIRNNPVHTLITSLVPTPDFFGSVGLPVKDNVLSVAAEGKLGWSIGPLQGLNAHGMNPWWKLVT